MFGKTNNTQPAKKLETLIGSESTIEGQISCKGTLRLDGKIKGGITESATVIIGENGEVCGDIVSGNIVVGGIVNGNIMARNSIEILPKAKIQGNITTPSISIAEGAVFEGNCTMTKRKNDLLEMELAACPTVDHPLPLTHS